MPSEDEPTPQKPYRVYRGGRTKGRVPLQGRERAAPQAARAGGDGRRPPRPGPPAKPSRRRGGPTLRSSTFWLRFAGFCFLAVFVLGVVWAVLTYFAIRGGASEANKRLPRGTNTALAGQDGLLLFHSTTILYLGLDHSRLASRSGARHSDTILLIRTDPDRHRLAYLSIPRDLRVEIPGYGFRKINASYQLGGAPLALKTIGNYTGLPLNHVMIADFNNFREVIDELGGIDVYVPERILSNPFDCPYSFERCQTWKGWRFAKGWQHMNGWRALIYSRIRENQLNPSESDLTRGERQQAVLQATLHRLTTMRTFIRLPFMGGDVFRPLATDLSAAEILQLGWNFKRANTSRTLHCRLGGTTDDDSELGSVIQPTEENRSVVLMFKGDSAPQPPLPGSGPYGPGCVVGSATFRR